MAQARVYEGTWDELAARADELRGYGKLTLIIPAQQDSAAGGYRAEITPGERIRRLDAVAERNRRLPALPPEAFDRETLYAEDEEL
jgi:hypothetical protein